MNTLHPDPLPAVAITTLRQLLARAIANNQVVIHLASPYQDEDTAERLGEPINDTWTGNSASSSQWLAAEVQPEDDAPEAHIFLDADTLRALLA